MLHALSLNVGGSHLSCTLLLDAGGARLPDEPPSRRDPITNATLAFAAPYPGSGFSYQAELDSALNTGFDNSSVEQHREASLNFAYRNYVDCVVSIALRGSGVTLASALALSARRYREF